MNNNSNSSNIFDFLNNNVFKDTKKQQNKEQNYELQKLMKTFYSLKKDVDKRVQDKIKNLGEK